MDSNNELTFAHDALITSITYVIMFYNTAYSTGLKVLD